MLTSPPYLHGDVVTYRCYSGFSMSGVPSQSCDNGTWSGSTPSCLLISRADLHEQSVDFREGDSGTMMMGMVGVVSAVLLLPLLLLAAGFCFLCRRCRKRPPHEEDPGRNAVEVTGTDSVRSTRLVDVVSEVARENRDASTASTTAKHIKGWRPFCNPVRDINTSTQ
ncbi:hypothetical protein ACOMHN_061197 [Nucella lapillus]